VFDNTNVPAPDFVNATPLAPLEIMPDNVNVSFVALATLIVSVPLTTLLALRTILPLKILLALELFSVMFAPLFKLIALGMLSVVPLNASIAPLATVAVAALLPRPLLFATTTVPPLIFMVPV